MDLLALLETSAHVLDVLLHRLSHAVVLLVEVGLTDLVLVCFLEDVDAVEPLDALLQPLVVVEMVVQDLVDLVLELLLVLLLLLDLLLSVGHLLLHTLALEPHISHDEAQVLVDDEEMLGLVVHLRLLLLQALDHLHSWSDSRLKLLDLVVEHELELLQLLGLLAILVNLLLLVSDGALSLVQLRLHLLDVGLLTISGGDLLVQLGVLLLDLLLKVDLVLLSQFEVVLDEGKLTLLLHTTVNFDGQELLILLLDVLNLLPGLVLDHFSVGPVGLDHLLDLSRQLLLLLFELSALDYLVTVELFHKLLVRQIGLTHEHLELLEVVLLLILELLIPVLVSLPLLSLIVCLGIQSITVLVHPSIDLLLVASLHVASLLLDLLHVLASLELLLLHLTSQILSLLLVLEHQGSLLFLPVSILGLDGLLQIADLLLQLISLLLLDEDLLRHVGQLSLVSVAVHDLEDSQSTVSARSIQELVVVADTDAVDHLRVGLNLKDLVRLEGIHDDLHTSWLVGLIDTSEECSIVVHHFDLIQTDTLVKSLNLNTVYDLSNRLVLSSSKD